jgi:hypothetical protein
MTKFLALNVLPDWRVTLRSARFEYEVAVSHVSPAIYRTLSRLGLATATFFMLWGCSSGAGSSDADSNDTDGLADPDTSTPTDTFTVAQVTYWGLSGQLTTTPEGLSTELSSLQLAQRGEQDSCDLQAAIVEVEEQVSSDAGSWRLTVLPDAQPSCPWTGPTELVVSFGPTDTDLAPAADHAGLSASTAFGLYLSTPSLTEPLLIGVAGTSAQLQGVETADPTVPLAEGSYVLHTLYGVPL